MATIDTGFYRAALEYITANLERIDATRNILTANDPDFDMVRADVLLARIVIGEMRVARVAVTFPPDNADTDAVRALRRAFAELMP